jgi:hypothetical protein
MPIDTEQIVNELKEVLDEACELVPETTPQYESGSHTSQAISLMRSAIERFTPEDSSYRRQVAKLLQHPVAAARAGTANDMIGALQALIRDFDKGRLRSIEELIHSDVSGDYLQQAETLLRAGYKDPAVVLVGSVLEQHLRQLAGRRGISAFAGGTWKKADRLNADLAKAGIYGKTEQKSVTALLGRRNDAAHGDYDQYSTGDVRLMIEQIEGFLARFPA